MLKPESLVRGSFVVMSPDGWIKCDRYKPGTGDGVGVVTEAMERTYLVRWKHGTISEHFRNELIQTDYEGTPVAYGLGFQKGQYVRLDKDFPPFSAGSVALIEGIGFKDGRQSYNVRRGDITFNCDSNHISQYVVISGSAPAESSPGDKPETAPEPEKSEAERKEEAHLKLSAWDIKPGYAFEHYKGGIYDVVAVSIMEDTLEPLVTYQSRKLKTFTTRTVKQFLGRVQYESSACNVGRPRFMRSPGHDAKEPTRPKLGKFPVVNLNQSPYRFTLFHATEADAKTEAERLARKNPGDKFATLQVLGEVRAIPAPVDWTDPVSGELIERREAKVILQQPGYGGYGVSSHGPHGVHFDGLGQDREEPDDMPF